MIFNELVFELAYDKNVDDASNNILPGLLTTITSIVSGVLLCFYLYRKYDPSPARYMVRGKPIQGWLTLLAFSLVLSPFVLLYDFFQHPELLTGTGWMAFLAAKNYGIFSFVFLSHLYNVLKLPFVVMLIVLFFQRRSSFPKLMSVQLALNLIVISTDTLLSRGLAEDPSSVSLKHAIQSLIGAAIWIPYLNISQQAKETFVIRRPGFDDDKNDEASAFEETSVSTHVEEGRTDF